MALNAKNMILGQHLIHALREAILRLHTNISINWISSHSKVTGNKEADCLAKKVAKGRFSAAVDLPPLFRNPLPKSALASKQAFNRNLLNQWLTIWNRSPRKPRITQLGETFPFTKFNKMISNLS